MKKVFFSHPLGNNIRLNRQLVDILIKEFRRQYSDILFISPIHKFGYIKKEDEKIREAIMESCFSDIEDSDELWLGGVSSGCRDEVRKAIKEDKEIFVIEGKLEVLGYDNEKKDYIDFANRIYKYNFDLEVNHYGGFIQERIENNKGLYYTYDLKGEEVG